MPTDQLDNLVTNANSSKVEKEKNENQKDFWLVYSCRNEKNGKSQKAFIRTRLYKSLKPSDRVSVDSGEITTDLNVCAKSKKRIREQLYYEENSKFPALFTEQEIMRSGGPIEVREGKSFRAGTEIIVLTYAKKCKLQTIQKRNEIDIQSPMLLNHGISTFSEDVLHQIVLETSPHKPSNEGIIKDPSNDLWLAFSSTTVTTPTHRKVYYIKKNVYEGLSDSDRISLHTGQITIDTNIQIRNKKQISKYLYYEICSMTPALFTEEEIRKPGGAIERRAGTSYRRGTSKIVLTYDAKCQITYRLRRRCSQIYRDATSSAEKNFEMYHDANTASLETEKNPMNDDIFSIPENILNQILIGNPLELPKESVNFSDSAHGEKNQEREQIEMINSFNKDSNHAPDNNNTDFSSTDLITTNIDELFVDSYWDEFKERDGEIVNDGTGDHYANNFKLFHPVVTELGRHNFELEELPKPKINN